MYNSPCVNCKKPMNGGVYRKSNECPHCSTLQDTGVLAAGKTAVKAPAKPVVKNTATGTQAKPSKQISPASAASKSNNANDDELAAALAAHRAAVAAKKQRAPAAQTTNKASQRTVPKKTSSAPQKTGTASSPTKTRRTSANHGSPAGKTAQKPPLDNRQSVVKKSPSIQSDAKARSAAALAAINKVVEAEKKRSN